MACDNDHEEKLDSKKRDKKIQELKELLNSSNVIIKQKDDELAAFQDTIQSYMKQFSDLQVQHEEDLSSRQENIDSLRELLKCRDEQIRQEREKTKIEKNFDLNK